MPASATRPFLSAKAANFKSGTRKTGKRRGAHSRRSFEEPADADTQTGGRTMTAAQKHIPVMLKEVLEHLSPQDGETYVDATFGNGGYSEAILKAANCRLIAIDRDPTVLPRVEELKEKYGSRFEFRQGTFGNFKDIIAQPVNGAVFDIGVSSMQLDEAERGFSFAKDAPLDMRMSCTGRTAADLVN